MTALDLILALDPCRKASAPLMALISIAESQTGQAYGKNRTLAVAYLTLHWAALQERGKGGAAGQITSESEGDLSRTYAATAQAAGSADAGLLQTSWGMELKRLRKGSFIAGGLRNRMDCA